MSAKPSLVDRGALQRRYDLAVAVLSPLVLVSSILAIRSDLGGETNLHYVTKPLTMVLIIAIARLGAEPPSIRYRRLVVAGLLFSLGGDVLLMLPGDYFLYGLSSFLVAQIFYILAFSSVGGFYRSWWAAALFALFGLGVMWLLWPNLGPMRLPALAYVVAILVMAWQAMGQWRQTGRSRALLAFVGALFFVLSDTALALNRFGFSFEAAPLVVLSTYFSAQWLIALSTGAVRA
jgi:uncharacterized membrane protein YhhN